MSSAMGVVLERLTVPEDLVPREHGFGNGRAISYRCSPLSGICERIGVTRLDRFIVDHDVLLTQAMKAAGWVEPESEEWSEAEVAAEAELIGRLQQEIARDQPWYDPADGLRTVRGLIDAIRRGIPQIWLDEDRELRIRRRIDSGMSQKFAQDYERPLDQDSFGAALCDLRSFDLELAFAVRNHDRFRFWVTY